MKQTVRIPRAVMIVFVPILVIGALLLTVWFSTRPTYVFSVNGVKVEREELVWAMVENRISVATQVEELYGADSADADFWDRQFDGKTPNERLREVAAQAIIADKVQLLTAKDYGIDAMLSYSEVEAARDAENDKRAVGNGEIAYGPQVLSFSTFYTNHLLEVQTQLKEKLRLSVLEISDAQVQAYYNEHAEEYVTETGEQQSLEDVKALIRAVLENRQYDVYVQELADKASVEYYDAFHTVTEADSISE